MKYPHWPLSRFLASPSTISAHNSSLPIRKSRLRPTIDFQPLSFHQLTNPSSSNSFVLSSIQIPRVSNPTSLQKGNQPMTPQVAKSSSMHDPNRCNYRFPNGMRCRLIGFGTQPFCPKHTQVAVPPQPDPAEIASTLTVNLDDFTSAAQINDFLS